MVGFTLLLSTEGNKIPRKSIVFSAPLASFAQASEDLLTKFRDHSLTKVLRSLSKNVFTKTPDHLSAVAERSSVKKSGLQLRISKDLKLGDAVWKSAPAIANLFSFAAAKVKEATHDRSPLSHFISVSLSFV